MATSMVTGGTSGIGREFVTQLAARGDDIVIVARDTERMAAIKADVEARYGVSVETIAADLSRREDVDQITTRVEDPNHPVDLLVNNAGFAVHAKILDPEALELHDRAVEVMMRAVLVLSAAAGRAMKARGHGAILNLSSSSAWINTGNYSAIKRGYSPSPRACPTSWPAPASRPWRCARDGYTPNSTHAPTSPPTICRTFSGSTPKSWYARLSTTLTMTR